MSRHKSRELAAQLLYQLDLDKQALSDQHLVERFWREQSLAPQETRPFFEHLVRGVGDHLPGIDRLITAALDKWRLDRLERVDLAILRLATFELCFEKGKEKADVAVVIDEAIEIAKRFGNQDSASFINGVLDRIAKTN